MSPITSVTRTRGSMPYSRPASRRAASGTVGLVRAIYSEPSSISTPSMAYLVDNNVAEVLAENGRELVVHVPIVGAEAMMETIAGFDDIATNLGEQAKIVVWVHEALKGVIEPGGRDFEEIQAYTMHRQRVMVWSECPTTPRSCSRRTWISFFRGK